MNSQERRDYMRKYRQKPELKEHYRKYAEKYRKRKGYKQKMKRYMKIYNRKMRLAFIKVYGTKRRKL